MTNLRVSSIFLTMLTKYFLVGFLGLIGIFLRFSLSMLINRGGPTEFPLGTFFINLVGSLFIGIIYVLGTEKMILSPDLKTGIMVGLLGGFTTFSAFSLETLNLFENSKFLQASLYLGLSPVLGVLCAWAGVALTRLMIR